MWLTISSGSERGRSVQATGERFVIGRGEDCDLVLGDEKVSRRHAVLQLLPDGRTSIQDLSSANGTLVNGQRIQVPLLLHGGEQLQLGDTLLSVSRTVLGGIDDGPPPGQATVVGAAIPPQPAAPSKRPGPATTERLILRRSMRRTSILAVLALVVTVAVATLLVTGVLPPGGREPSTSEIVAAVTPSTVLVITTQNGERLGSGTGWVLDANEGLIVTNHHVVNAGSGFVIGVGEQQRPAVLVATAPCEDLAVLKVGDTSGLRTMPLGSQDDLRIGATVVAVGFPDNASLRAELTATTGVVSVPRTTFVGAGEFPDYPDVIRTDAAVNPGNSGGPLISTRKALVGVNTVTSLQLQNANYAIGVDRVKEITATLRQGRSLAWTGMGLFFPTQESDLTQLGLPVAPGIVAGTALPGSPAAQAGFGEAPALIVAIDGKPMEKGMPSYCGAVGNHRQGQSALFSVIPAGSAQPIDVPVAFA